MEEQKTVKVLTLRATCKKCGVAFTYERRKNLMGSPRSVCDECRRTRNMSSITRKSPMWQSLVSEREEKI